MFNLAASTTHLFTQIKEPLYISHVYGEISEHTEIPHTHTHNNWVKRWPHAMLNCILIPATMASKLLYMGCDKTQWKQMKRGWHVEKEGNKCGHKYTKADSVDRRGGRTQTCSTTLMELVWVVVAALSSSRTATSSWRKWQDSSPVFARLSRSSFNYKKKQKMAKRSQAYAIY